MSVRVFIASICIMFSIVCNSFAASNDNYIYGKVTTIDGHIYTGFINWGDGSFLWCNIFNADKVSNPYYDYVPSSKRSYSKRIVGEDGGVRIVRRNYYNPSIHVFETRFGNLKSIELTEDGTVYIELKNEKFLPVKNRFKDVGRSFYVNDNNLGVVKIEWRRFKKVEFMSAPKEVGESGEKPIYGTVNSTQGIFTGFIIWDRDENKVEDKLDGKYNGNDVAVKFKNIKRIRKSGEGCDLELVNKQKIHLVGSNDVNYKNRGMFVSMPNTGRVYIKWRDIISLDLLDSNVEAGISYSDFKPVERLKGKVYTNDSTFLEGIIVFDLDEAMDSEILQGSNRGYTYKLPFKYIKAVERINADYSKVELNNGAVLMLGDSADVNYKNDGVLVFMSSTDYQFLYWDEVDKIVFE